MLPYICCDWIHFRGRIYLYKLINILGQIQNISYHEMHSNTIYITPLNVSKHKIYQNTKSIQSQNMSDRPPKVYNHKICPTIVLLIRNFLVHKKDWKMYLIKKYYQSHSNIKCTNISGHKMYPIKKSVRP